MNEREMFEMRQYLPFKEQKCLLNPHVSKLFSQSSQTHQVFEALSSPLLLPENLGEEALVSIRLS